MGETTVSNLKTLGDPEAPQACPAFKVFAARGILPRRLGRMDINSAGNPGPTAGGPLPGSR